MSDNPTNAAEARDKEVSTRFKKDLESRAELAELIGQAIADEMSRQKRTVGLFVIGFAIGIYFLLDQ